MRAVGSYHQLAGVDHSWRREEHHGSFRSAALDPYIIGTNDLRAALVGDRRTIGDHDMERAALVEGSTVSQAANDRVGARWKIGWCAGVSGDAAHREGRGNIVVATIVGSDRFGEVDQRAGRAPGILAADENISRADEVEAVSRATAFNDHVKTTP